jgi:zinc/manganese transport system permease protein
MAGNPSFSADLIADARQLLTYPFMVNALEAGTIVAILAAVVGWFMVLRRQSFAGHTLSVMAFPGATGAALAGLPSTLGLYIACSAAAVAIGGGDPRAKRGPGRETAAIGTIQTLGLAAGFLFLSLNRAVLGGPETLLFGTFLGVTNGQVVVLAVVTVAVLGVLMVIGRPLLFATIDPEVARARGVPVRVLDIGFLLLLGLAVAATSQITGALLVFALLVAPAAGAQQITSRPVVGLLLSVVLAVLVVWLALAMAYFSVYPVGFYVTTLALVLYLLIGLGRRIARRWAR